MTTHTIDTTNSAGCSPCTPAAHQRSGDVGLREALYDLWLVGFDPEILKLRHTSGNLVKIEHALTKLLDSLITTQERILVHREWVLLFIQQSTSREKAKAVYEEICETEERTFKATMDGSPLDVLVGECVTRLQKRQQEYCKKSGWTDEENNLYIPSTALQLAWEVECRLSSIASICKDHDKRKLLRKVNSKPSRD